MNHWLNVDKLALRRYLPTLTQSTLNTGHMHFEMKCFCSTLVDDSTEVLYFSPYRYVGIMYAISFPLHFFRLGCAKKENRGFLFACKDVDDMAEP